MKITRQFLMLAATLSLAGCHWGHDPNFKNHTIVYDWESCTQYAVADDTGFVERDLILVDASGRISYADDKDMVADPKDCLHFNTGTSK